MPKPRILIVEDESIVALDIQRRLIRLGYDVPAIASSWEEALQIVTQTFPDLVLMDIKLRGEVDGVEAAERIRSHSDVPVIYLSAYADEETIQRAKITEPFGYLLKPFEETELHTTIEVALYKHAMEKRLRESEEWLSITLKSIGDAVIATDARGCIRFVNPTAEALTGWEQEEALGRDLTDIFRTIYAETRLTRGNPTKRVLRDGHSVFLSDNTLLLAADGREIPIDGSAAPVRGERGSIRGAVLVFRDITERVQAEEALRRYAADLEARNEELDAFAHTVAHDIQSPLTVVIGFADSLKDDYTNLPFEEVEYSLQTISQYGRKISNIAEELLLLASVRRMEEVDVAPLATARIVTEAMGRLAPLIEEYRAEIILPERWPTAVGYAPWVEEIWTNLLSNAILHGGRPPRVEVGAAAWKKSNGTEPERGIENGKVFFWVRDNGPGLPADQQARLFTPFTRLDQVRTAGHGLGLSIVRRIVERLGGEVGVKSAAEQGSVFSFTLPAKVTGSVSR
jgi:PAS domain S-box-containing protein